MRNLRIPALFAFLAILSVPSFGQSRTQWRTAGDIQEGIRGTIVGTVVDVNEGNSQIQISADDDRYNNVRVLTDSVSTTYNGFGGVINGSPEIFTGTAGFSNIRMNDRLEVRGTGRGTGIVMAEQVTLLGRPVASPQTGVGQTRTPTSISTPTPAASTTNVYATVEGVIRQVNAADNRVVVETDRREIFNIRTTSTTPVYYRGDVYQVRNLEEGDRIRVQSDTSSATPGSDVRARAIDVVQSVQESGTSNVRVSSIAGRVTQIDRTADIVKIDTGRGQIVRIDMGRAADATGRRIQAADLQVGDRIDVSGSYGANSNIFVASTVRFTGGNVNAPPPAVEQQPDRGDYVTVTISGTVTETLQNAATLGVRDRASDRTVEIFVTEDFVVRTKSGGYETADRLAVGDNVLLKAFRDEDGNLIAQTIRIR